MLKFKVPTKRERFASAAAMVLDELGLLAMPDYFTLDGATVGELVRAAGEWGYKHRADAPGCKARMFYEYLCRIAAQASR